MPLVLRRAIGAVERGACLRRVSQCIHDAASDAAIAPYVRAVSPTGRHDAATVVCRTVLSTDRHRSSRSSAALNQLLGNRIDDIVLTRSHLLVATRYEKSRPVSVTYTALGHVLGLTAMEAGHGGTTVEVSTTGVPLFVELGADGEGVRILELMQVRLGRLVT